MKLMRKTIFSTFILFTIFTYLLVNDLYAATFTFAAGSGYVHSSNVAYSRSQLGGAAYNISGDLTINASVATVNVTLDQNIGGAGTLTKTGPGTLSLGQTGGVGGFGNGAPGTNFPGQNNTNAGVGGGGGGTCGTAKPAGYSGSDGGRGLVYVEFYDANNGIVGHFQATGGSGSFTVPALAAKAKVWAAGGGGGGGGEPSGAQCGGGGGAGGVGYAFFNVNSGMAASYSVGGGGAGAYGTAQNGGNSNITIGSVSVSGNGGGGGQINNPPGSGGNYGITGTVISSGGSFGGSGAYGNNGAKDGGGGGAIGGSNASGSSAGSVNYAPLNNIDDIINRGTNANSFSGNLIINQGQARNIANNVIPDASIIQFANTAGASYNLNGFDETISAITGGGATGGTMTIPSGSSLSINSGSGTNTFDGNLSGAGAITKNGGATQVLTGDNSTFSGSTSVTAGEYRILGKYASGITLTGGKVSGTPVSTAALNASGTSIIQPGVTAGTASTMKLGSLTMAGNSVTINTNATIPSDIQVTGAVNLGTATFNIMGGLPKGVYTLVKGSSMSGTPVLGTNNTGNNAYLVIDGTELKLVVKPEIILTTVTTALTEGGANGSVKVKLNAKPLGNVTVSMTSADTGAVSVSPATLTFTTANWGTDQTVTLTPVNDNDIRNESVVVTAAIVPASTSNEWDTVASVTATATVADDDTAGYTLSKTALTVAENAGSGTFTVVLTAEPTSNVVVSLTSSSTSEATVSPASITFGPVAGTGVVLWNAAQTVTVTGVDDSIDRDDTATITASITDASSDNAWDPLADQTVAITLTDNDTAGFTVSKTTASAAEQGATDSFTVKLNSQPVSNVIVNIASSDTGAATVSSATLTFTPTNWNTAQTITLTGVDDADIVNESVTIDVSIDPSAEANYKALAKKSVALTVVDNDTAGFTLSTTALTIAKNAGTGTYTVVLNAQPQSDVVISITSAGTTEATVSGSTLVGGNLTFTSTNWNTAQTITVTGVNDDVDTLTNDSTTIKASVVDASSDDAWDPLADKSVSVTLTDDDTSTIITSATSLTIAEAAGTGTFKVRLSSQPLTDVVLNVSSSLVGEGTVSPATLTFTNLNWNTDKIVTVTGVDDKIDTASDSTSNIDVSVNAGSSYDSYDSAPKATIVATFSDDDTAGFTVSKTSLTVAENAGTGTFTVVLNTQPIAGQNVVFDVTSSSTADGTVSVTNPPLTFTDADWNQAKTVTVTGVNDNIDTASDETSTITVKINTVAVTGTTDSQYKALTGTNASKTVATTFTDDDTAGFTVSKTTLSAAENAGTDTFTVVLNSQPPLTKNVVFNVTSSSTADGTVSSAKLTFTNANWNTAQTVTLTAVNDNVDTPSDDTATITVALDKTPTGTTDGQYIALTGVNASKTLAATFVDDDSPGFTLSKSSLTVGENGGTGTFTVVLNTQPLPGTVVKFNVTSSATSEGTVSVTNPPLTFTDADWNQAKTVTVTGVNDSSDTIADDTATISVAIDATATGTTDSQYKALTGTNATRTVAATFTDDDTASYTVSTANLTVGENAGTGTFTIVLGTQPLTNVVINLASSDTLQGTVSASSVTFTPSNWNTPKTVTVTGVNDAVDTVNDDTANINITVDATSYGTFTSLASKKVAVTFTDDDVAGFTVSASNVTIGENNGSGTFTVVLDTQPTSDVIISVTSNSTTNVTASPASLTFSPTNWNTAQLVTLTGVDDSIDTPTNDTATITLSVVDASSDNKYDPLNDKTVSVTATDDDVADFILSATTLNVGENQGTNSFTIKLATQPQSNVVLNISSSATSEGTVAPASLTFTPTNWNLTQSVTVTGVDDFTDTASNSTSNIVITVNDASSDNQFDPILDKTVVATFIDDDQPGFSINVVDNATGENGDTGSFKIKLNSQPTANVTLALSSSNTAEGTIAVSSITFTPANWNIEQTVTVTGVNDSPPMADGAVAYDIVTGDVTSTDLQYDVLTGADVADIAMTNQNDDAPGINGTLTGFTTEAGGTATVKFELLSMPTANVVIPLSISDSTEGSISITSLTITPANWNNLNANVVTITGVDDFVVDGNIIYKLVTGDPTSTDTNYNGLGASDVADISITNNDDDSAGVIVTQNPATVSVTEGGAASFYSIYLKSQPTADVTITLSNGAQITASPKTLTFTPLNWNKPQEISVLAVDDTLVEATTTDSITHVATSTDTLYNGISVATKSVSVIDDDAAGFNLSKISSTIAENGATDTFTVVLSAQPLTDVKILVSSSDTSQATIGPASVTFTNSNWNVPQTITITAVDDLTDTALNDTATINLTVDDPNSNDLFDSAPDKSVSVTLTDNDTAGYTITPGSMTIAESGGSSTFTVVLNTKPLSNVVFGIISSSLDDATVDKTSLTFTPANWNVTQTVTVNAVDDFVDTPTNDLTTVTASIIDASSDDQYDPLADKSVTVDITDNDNANFVVSVSTLTIAENAGTGTFTVTLGTKPRTDVVLDIISSATADATVDFPSLTFTPLNWDQPQTIKVTAINNDYDTPDKNLNISVSVHDASSDDQYDPLADKIVAVTIPNDDTAGFAVSSTTMNVGENNGTGTFDVKLTSKPLTDVVISITSTDPTNGTISISTLTFTPANWNTPQTVTITGINDQHTGSTSDTSNIVLSVLDASSDNQFDPLPDQTIVVTFVDDDTAILTATPPAPVINPTDGSPITGLGVPGDTVTVKDPSNNILCTAIVQPDGTWSCTPATVPPAGTVITAIQTSVLGQDSTPTTTTIYDPNNASKSVPPTVNPVNDIDTVVTGTGVIGATITIPGVTCTNAPIIVSGSGQWKCNLSTPLTAGTIVKVSMQEPGKTASDPVSTIVSDADTTSPAPPVVNPTDGSPITGTGEPGNTVVIYDENGIDICTTVVLPDGTWSCTPTTIPPNGAHLDVTQTDDHGNSSPPTNVIVDQTKPAAPIINPIKTTDTVITGTGEPGATVNVTGTTCTNAPVVVMADGTWKCTLASTLPVDTIVTATLTDPAGNTSDPSTTKVYDASKTSESPTLNPINTLDKVISGTAVPGATITLTGATCTNNPIIVSGSGIWTCNLAATLPLGTIVTATSTEAGKDPSPQVSTKVSDASSTSPAAPVLNPTDGSPITGFGEPGNTINVTDNLGNVICTAVVGTDGKWNCTPATIPANGTKLKVTQTDPDGNVSPPAYGIVDQQKPNDPTIDPVDATTTTVTGTGEPGDTITLTGVTCTNNPIIVDRNGKWSCKLANSVNSGLTITAYQTDPAGNDSGTVKLVLSEDLDGDGVSDAEEKFAIGGDGNQDGVKDYLQSAVVSRKNPVTNAGITMIISGDCNNGKGFTISNESQMTVADPNYDYPLGIFGFKLLCKKPGESATIDFVFDKVYDTANWKWRKFEKSTYFDWTQFITYSVKSVNGVNVTVGSIKVTDGGKGDEDGLANGTIIDPSGPAMPIALPKTGNDYNIPLMIMSLLGVLVITAKPIITIVKRN